jgi:hypothetical protein
MIMGWSKPGAGMRCFIAGQIREARESGWYVPVKGAKWDRAKIKKVKTAS